MANHVMFDSHLQVSHVFVIQVHALIVATNGRAVSYNKSVIELLVVEQLSMSR